MQSQYLKKLVSYLHAYVISNYRYPTLRKSKPQHFQHVDWILLLRMRQDMPLKSLAKSLQQPQWLLEHRKTSIQDLQS